MIELRRAHADILIDEVSLAMQGTNIYLDVTALSSGKKYLRLRVGGVGAAVHITDWPMGSWTISVQAESSQGVGVLSQDAVSICVGPAQSATGNGITEK